MLIFDSRSLQTSATLEFLLLGENLLLRKIGLDERKTLFGTDVGVPIKQHHFTMMINISLSLINREFS